MTDVHTNSQVFTRYARAAGWLLPFLLWSAYEIANDEGFDGVFSLTIAGQPLLRIIVLAGLMAAGVLCSLTVQEISTSRQTKVEPLALIRAVAFNSRAWIALLVSPLVFAAVYHTTKSEPDSIIAGLGAFQNGFFWDTVFSRVQESGYSVSQVPK